MELPLCKNSVLVQNHSNEVEFDFLLNKPVSITLEIRRADYEHSKIEAGKL